MNERFIIEFEEYLQKSKIKGIHYVNRNEEIEIRPTLFNHKIAVDLTMLAAGSLGVWAMEDKDSSLWFILLIYCVLVGILLNDFSSINTVIIDKVGKKIFVQNRNVVIQFFYKYILRRKNRFEFADISSFDVRDNESFKPGLRRFFITMKLKVNSKKGIFSFSKEEPALRTANFLNHFVTR